MKYPVLYLHCKPIFRAIRWSVLASSIKEPPVQSHDKVKMRLIYDGTMLAALNNRGDWILRTATAPRDLFNGRGQKRQRHLKFVSDG